jgi:hypothetical protein
VLDLGGPNPEEISTALPRRLRKRGIGHQAALRQLGNRLVGILHGCLKTNTTYEATTWAQLQPTS